MPLADTSGQSTNPLTLSEGEGLVPNDVEGRPKDSPFRLAGRSPRLSILMIASEVAPWAKTGGLADVTGALPEALERLGHDVTTCLPRYRGGPLPESTIVNRSVRLGGVTYDIAFHVSQISPRRRIVMIDVPALFDRDGYYGQGGKDFADNAERFAVLAAAALDFAEHDTRSRPAEIVHAHDWQAGLAPVLLRTMPARYPRLQEAGVVFTIHNLAYQGLFAKEVVPAFGLPWSAFTVDTGEFYGQFSYLKSGIEYSDFVTTVSPSYAEETQRAEFGCGMDGVLAARSNRYVGILNGIDTAIWNPATDPMLPAHFDRVHLDGKFACKRALLERFGLSVGDDALARPVVGLVSRLVEQKGLDLIQQASEELLQLDASWVFVGTGDSRYETFLRLLQRRYPNRVGTYIGFNEALAHLVEAGSDLFLMPSKFEPCGLNQMYSLRYGTVPVVHAVGGLEDTVQPYTARAAGANGFKFREATPDVLVRTLKQALRLFHEKSTWASLVRNGMAADHGWETSAREYVRVYRRARQAAATRAAH